MAAEMNTTSLFLNVKDMGNIKNILVANLFVVGALRYFHAAAAAQSLHGEKNDEASVIYE